MKKVIIFVSIIIALFAAIAIITNIQQRQAAEGNPYGKATLNQSTIDQLEDPNYQNIVLPDELEEKLKSEEHVTVYFYSPECIYCQQTTPIINPVAEELGVDLLQYNLLEFQEGFRDYNITQTPTTVHFQNGNEVARIVGAYPADEFKAFFSEYSK